MPQVPLLAQSFRRIVLLPAAVVSLLVGAEGASAQSCDITRLCQDFAAYKGKVCGFEEKCNLPRNNPSNPPYCNDSFCSFYNCRVVSGVRKGPIVQGPSIEVEVGGSTTRSATG